MEHVNPYGTYEFPVEAEYARTGFRPLRDPSPPGREWRRVVTTPGGDRVRLRLAEAGYRRLWPARTASQWGDVFATVALSLLVLDLSPASSPRQA